MQRNFQHIDKQMLLGLELLANLLLGLQVESIGKLQVEEDIVELRSVANIRDRNGSIGFPH